WRAALRRVRARAALIGDACLPVAVEARLTSRAPAPTPIVAAAAIARGSAVGSGARAALPVVAAGSVRAVRVDRTGGRRWGRCARRGVGGGGRCRGPRRAAAVIATEPRSARAGSRVDTDGAGPRIGFLRPLPEVVVRRHVLERQEERGQAHVLPGFDRVRVEL